MNELPKRIMAWGHFGDDSVTGKWSSNTYHNDNVVEYVRSDLVAELVSALGACRDELDLYSKHKYPSDHPIHVRRRKRDYEANPARIAIAKLMAPT